ncbi:hypothetical protein [Thioclava sp. GXIMD4215]|uniref:hypothetical protein n=1 Tax=Thioclava sp. GXIMD4215 TaxID=3131928 RepID=UPI00311B2663
MPRSLARLVAPLLARNLVRLVAHLLDPLAGLGLTSVAIARQDPLAAGLVAAPPRA